MHTTFVLRNLTDDALARVAAMAPSDAHTQLAAWAFGDLKHCVTQKCGSSNSFGDRVRWNSVVKANAIRSFKIEPRRGYKLATFEG